MDVSLSLEGKVAEFYHNIDRRRYWFGSNDFITFSRQLLVSLRLTDLKTLTIFMNNRRDRRHRLDNRADGTDRLDTEIGKQNMTEIQSAILVVVFSVLARATVKSGVLNLLFTSLINSVSVFSANFEYRL